MGLKYPVLIVIERSLDLKTPLKYAARKKIKSVNQYSTEKSKNIIPRNPVSGNLKSKRIEPRIFAI
jgi:hypothetical protein